MTQFVFRLQPLLSLRESERDARRSELAAAYAEQERAAGQRQSLLAEQARQHEVRRAASGGGLIDLEQLRACQIYEAGLRDRLAEAAELLRRAEILVEQRQDVLAVAEREVEVLEKLRQRQQEQHRAQQARGEQRRVDEIAARQFWQARPAA